MNRNSPVVIYPFKNEHILNNSSEKIERRIKALIETWGELGSLPTLPTRENLKTLSEYLKSHTLDIVLSASWLKYQSKYYLQLGEAITKCEAGFQNYNSFQKLCRKLVFILKAPWQKSTIIKMLNCTKPITQIEDYNFFVYEESGYFISMRLKKLCEDKCEDMALNLTRAYIKCCEWADLYSKDMCITGDQRKFIFDVYLALLYNLNCTSEMSSFLKNVSLPEGVDMVKRFSIKLVSASKIWVNSIRIAQLSATIFLTRGVMQPYEETAVFLNKLLDVWLPTYESEVDYEELVECLRRIIKNALTASHMYLFCKQLSNKFGVKLRSYNVEIYIQALNTDLNMLEKLKTENEAEKYKETSSRVADGLLCLANLLVENLNVARECILSAFSLKPTESCFREVEDAARASGYHVLDTGQWKCKFHPPAKPDDELLIICESCNEFMSELKISPALQQPNTALSEALNTNNMGLNEQICDDLVVIIFCARYQLLSWLQNWDDLHRLSVMYLHDPDKTKNLITELKFIEKDYTQFLIKRELECADPYESHVDRDIFEEYIECKRKKKRKRIGSSEDDDESYDSLYMPHARKLDSEEAKTLRTFRRSLKKIEEPTIQWYDTSQTAESSSQSSSSATSSSPIPFTESTVPMTGVQIRKDLYKDPSFGSHFHSNNDSLNIMQSNNLFGLNENFSEQPVIQIAEEQANVVETRVQEHLDNGADINENEEIEVDSTISFPCETLTKEEAESTDLTKEEAESTDLTKEEAESTDEGIEEMEKEIFGDDEYFYSKYMRTFPIIYNNLSKSPLLEDNCVNIDSVKNYVDCEMDALTNEELSDENAHETILEDNSVNIDCVKDHVDCEMDSLTNEEFSDENAHGSILEDISVNIDCVKSHVDCEMDSVTNEEFSDETAHETTLEDNSVNIDCVKDHVDCEMDLVTNEEFNDETTLEDNSVNIDCVKDHVDCEMDLVTNEEFSDETTLEDNSVNIDCVKNHVDCEMDSVTNEEFSNENAHETILEDNSVNIDCVKSHVDCEMDSLTNEEVSDETAPESVLEDNSVNIDCVKNHVDCEMDSNTNEEFSDGNAHKTILDEKDCEKSIDSGVTESSQDLNYLEIYNLKECSVMLNRIRDPFNKNLVLKQKIPHKRRVCKSKTRPKRKIKVFSDNNKTSENTVQSVPTKDENFNIKYNVPIKPPRSVLSANNTDGVLEALKKKLLVSSDKMNPRVILQRIEESCMKYLLEGVPGIKDTNLFRPENTDRIVNVVQVAGGRATSTVPAPNTQTSTQVSPHIQRIGQPRSEKTEQSNSETSSTPNTKPSNTYTITKPAATQSPTLINILSQQVIRPSPSNNNTRTRGGPLINILSQQTIKQSNTTAAPKATTTTTVTSESQGNIAPRIIATSSEQQIINQIVNPSRTTGPLKTVVGTSNSEQGRIVQFICKSTDGKLIPVTSFPSNRLVKVGTTQAVTAPDSPNLEDSFTKATKKTESNEISETLPKFQQAFGKSVYQNNVDSTNSSTNNINTNANADIEKNKTQIKTSSVSVQPIQGGVIYTRQMPVGQTINLIPQTRGQVFRIATTNPEQISLVKDTVIHSKMSALLAAALQGKPKNSDSTDAENTTENATTTSSNATRVQLTRPTLVQNARIVKPVLQIPSNVIRNAPQTNLSSTTLEQLREFDMVYKQVKERSSTSTPAESSTATESNESSPQRISVTYLNQTQKLNCAPVVVVSSYSNLQPAASPALSVASQGSSSPCVTPAPTPTPVLPKVAVKGSKGKTVKNAPMHASKTSPIPKPQQKPQEDEHTTQRIFDILAEYAEQLRNSPDLNNKPAPRRRSNPPTNPSQNSKRKKSSSSKKSGQCSSLSTDADIDDPRTVGSEDSSCGVVQLSMQDEEQTPTTASTSESNDSTTTSRQQLILTDSTHNQTRNLIIADSSVGEALKMPNTAVLVPGNYIMPVSMVKGGQQIAVVSGGSKILATVPARSGPNMLLFQSFLNQNRKSNVPTVKYSTIQPISGISSQTLTGVNAQSPVILPPPSHGISTVTLGQPIAIKKIEENDRVNTELLLTISQSRENNCTATEDTPQPDSSTSVVPKIESDLDENTAMSDNSSEKTFSYQKPLISTTPIATPVIAQNIKEELSDEQTDSTTTQTIMTLNINPLESKGEVKQEERVQSVLVTAGSSNGPMLSHSPPLYKQSDCGTTNEQIKDEFLRNGGKRNEKVQQNTVFCMQGKVKKAASSGRMDRDVHQICMRRQAALERELRLQKSLSEECEDLGVDEPSTSDLFPEALLFDANNSPSFDQTSQDLLKRPVQAQEKEESKLTLFSDDDFMFETNQYPSSDNQLCYEEVVENRMLTNGQNSTEPPCEDTTLLQTCTSMSDVTLSSPISPDTYHPHNSPPLNKYMHKYTNKKKSDRKQVDNWPAEVSSSEDTTGSNELVKCSSSPDLCMNKRSDEELSDGSFKVVRLSISKTECGDVNCINDADSISGRGARKSVKKMCSCCNGSEENAISRKRPSTQQHTNNPHKKAFPNKKR